MMPSSGGVTVVNVDSQLTAITSIHGKFFGFEEIWGSDREFWPHVELIKEHLVTCLFRRYRTF